MLILLGSISLGLGVVGVFIPVLPTTPFLLLASFCYLRGSERMYKWLINHKILGAYIYCYLNFKAISKKTKILTMIFLWATLIISMLVVPSPHIRILLVAVGIGVTIHLVKLKTLNAFEFKACADLNRNMPKEQALSNELKSEN